MEDAPEGVDHGQMRSPDWLRLPRLPIRSARVRIVGWLVGSVAVALGASILVTHLIGLEQLNERVDRNLTQEVAEFRALAERGIDPVTGRPFTDVRPLLRTSIERNVVDRNETLVAIVNGTPYVRSAQEPPVRLDEDPQLVARLAAATRPVLDSVDSRRGTVRYGVVPVQVPSSPDRGVLVAAVFLDLERAEINRTTLTSALVGFGTLALAAVAALVIAGRVLRPVRLVSQAAQEISETDLSRRIVVDGNDDVAELAHTFNTMLDRLETAFEGQRQFLNDASHELRTPITIVQGHLELLDADPETRAESMALVMDELDRMRRMVDDLLTLAKSDRPNFLRLSEVDLEPFTDEVMDKARALAPRAWHLDTRAEGVALLDRQRVTQALLQLALNATQHTAEGQEIHLGTRIRGDELHLWVRDSGRGVSPVDRERIFDRFARGSGPGGATSGSGLGLAIVQAIAHSHGGRVELLDVSAGGAEFRMELPLHPSPTAAPAARVERTPEPVA
jgi:two-component system OmpR family sensor kinase